MFFSWDICYINMELDKIQLITFNNQCEPFNILSIMPENKDGNLKKSPICKGTSFEPFSSIFFWCSSYSFLLRRSINHIVSAGLIWSVRGPESIAQNHFVCPMLAVCHIVFSISVLVQSGLVDSFFFFFGGGLKFFPFNWLVSIDLCWFEICCCTLCYTMSIMSSIDTSSQNAYGIVWSFWRKLLRSFLGVFIQLTIREDSGKRAMPFWKIVHLNVSVPVMHVVAGVAESKWFRSLGVLQISKIITDLWRGPFKHIQNLDYIVTWVKKTCHLGIVVCLQQPMTLWLWKLLLKLT